MGHPHQEARAATSSSIGEGRGGAIVSSDGAPKQSPKIVVMRLDDPYGLATISSLFLRGQQINCPSKQIKNLPSPILQPATMYNPSRIKAVLATAKQYTSMMLTYCDASHGVHTLLEPLLRMLILVSCNR
jgi:hypothetical protein